MNAQFKSAVRGIALAILLTLAYTASAFYDPNIGRWLSRDPIGEMGGVNLHGFVANSPLNIVDRNGMDYYPSQHVLNLPPIPPSPDPQSKIEALRIKFDAWYNEQKAKMDWLKKLPDCPCTLSKKKCHVGPIYPGLTTDEFYPPEGWSLVLTYTLQKYHPGGAFDLRQNVAKGDPGQQCVYDNDGKLITHGPGAGTPDLVGSASLGAVLGHIDADVTPFEWAEELDGTPGVPNPNGDYYKKYMEVRPPNTGKDATTGKPCPKNP